MRCRSHLWYGLLLLSTAVILVACGGNSSQESTSTQIPIEAMNPQPTKESQKPASSPTVKEPSEPTSILQPTDSHNTSLVINAKYLMAFHACDSFNIDCHDPRNHQVYLAEAENVKTWDLIPGWVPIQGSVPDLIRRGDTLYVYTGPWLVRYHFDTGILDEPVEVQISRGEGAASTEPVMLTDVSLIRDDKDRLVMFFLFGKKGGDPARCGPGETTCTKSIGSAIEVEDSDGGAFVVQAGERISAEIGEGKGFMSLSDPDILTDGRDFYVLLSHGTWISAWTSTELHGTFQKKDIPPMGFLSTGSGGVASGYYKQDEGCYWVFSQIHLEEGMVIRVATPKDLTLQLEESDWTTIISGEGIGLGQGFNVESPGFTVNEP